MTSAGDGGAPARRAVVRWAWRLFRREWRAHLLIVVLLTVTVAAAIFATSAVYNVAPVRGNAEFGTVDHFLRWDGDDPEVAASFVAAAAEWFGTIEVITRRQVPIPGSVESVEFRTQDPDGEFGAPMLDLDAGHYPAGGGEVAVTDGIAETFDLAIGTAFALDGVARTVVGIVENPSDLNADFVLVPVSIDEPHHSVTILVDADDERVQGFHSPGEETMGSLQTASRPSDEDVTAALGVLGVATVVMLLVSLVAAAGFVVLAQRRLRQLGLLAAIGATEKHLRLVTVAGGAAVGAVAAAVGGAVGVAGWVVAASHLEAAFGHRIDGLAVPWGLVVVLMLLALATATGAAWWPARVVARTPIVLALSGRPPDPQPTRRSAGMAAGLLVGGVACLVAADRSNDALIVVGTAATVAGVLLIGPLAIRVAAGAARRTPFPLRLALRDLGRYRARSGAALAAITLALGIPATIVISATAVTAADRGNLADTQLLVWTRNADDPEGVSPFYTTDPDDSGFAPFVPELTADEVRSLEVQVDRIAGNLDRAEVTPLDVAFDPAQPPHPTIPWTDALTLAQRVDDGFLDAALLYVANPDLMEQLGIDLDSIDPNTEVVTVLETEELFYPGLHDPSSDRFVSVPVVNIERIPAGHTSLPGSFITPEALRRSDWAATRVGWLVETSTPPTAEQLATARTLAADAGLLLESRDHRENLLAIRWQATGIGMLVALGVLAMTVGLIRGETQRDLRTLTATGATSGIRRTLTAATAGGLALLGSSLGIVGAYLALGAVSTGDLGMLVPVPAAQLLVLVAGVPMVAALTGWLVAGREPASLTGRFE